MANYGLKQRVLKERYLLEVVPADNEFGYIVYQQDPKNHVVRQRPIVWIKTEAWETKSGEKKLKFYACVNIMDYKEGVNKTKMLHQVVYAYFRGDIPAGMVVDHIDNDSCNNDLGNLRLLTPKANVMKDAWYKKTKVAEE